MICAACKSEFDDNSRFCPRCGAAKPDAFFSESEATHSSGASQFQNVKSGQSYDIPASEKNAVEADEGKPFFTETPINNSVDDSASTRAANSGSPYTTGYSPPQNAQKKGYYSHYRSESQKTQDISGEHSVHRDSHSARNSYDTQQSSYTQQNAQQAQYTGFPFQQKRTFDDKSIRNFLIGFTIVAVAVVTLVVTLVVISDAWNIAG